MDTNPPASPGTLPHAAAREPERSIPATISIIIPALNEAAVLDRNLSFIACLPHEIILVDGGSQDRTREIAGKYGIEILTTRQGRGLQLDEGARKAKGDILLFLHADTVLPLNFDRLS